MYNRCSLLIFFFVCFYTIQAMDTQPQKPDVVIIMGTPRCGKSSIAQLLQKALSDKAKKVHHISIDSPENWFSTQQELDNAYKKAEEYYEYVEKTHAMTYSSIYYKFYGPTQDDALLEKLDEKYFIFDHPLNTIIEKILKGVRTSDLWIFEYVSHSLTARNELAEILTKNRSRVLLVKLVCSKESALKRLHAANEQIERRFKEIDALKISAEEKVKLKKDAHDLYGGARHSGSLEGYYQNKGINFLRNVSYDLEYDTSAFSKQDYSKIIDDIKKRLL